MAVLSIVILVFLFDEIKGSKIIKLLMLIDSGFRYGLITLEILLLLTLIGFPISLQCMGFLVMPYLLA